MPNPGRNFPKGHTPWNKGLTKETDERIRKYGEKLRADLPDWECACGCGQKIDWRSRKGKYRREALDRGYAYIYGHHQHMPYVREAIKKAIRRGPDHPEWRGGITYHQKELRLSPEHKAWRETVFERDDYICQRCGKRGGDLQAHHIKPFAKYPELAFEIDNGLTLCVTCHKKEDLKFRRRNEKGQFAPGVCEV